MVGTSATGRGAPASAVRSSATVRARFTPRPRADVGRGEGPGALDERVEEREQRRVGLADRGPLSGHGGLVAAGHGTGQGGLGAVGGPVLHGLAHEGREQRPGLLGREARPGGHRLGCRLEGDEEVGGDRGRGVVARALRVVDLENDIPRRAASSRASASALGARAGDRTPGAGEDGLDLAREGLERMEPEHLRAGLARGVERGQPVAPLTWPTKRSCAGCGDQRGHRRGDLGVGDA